MIFKINSWKTSERTQTPPSEVTYAKISNEHNEISNCNTIEKNQQPEILYHLVTDKSSFYVNGVKFYDYNGCIEYLLDKDRKLEYFEALEKLIDKQKVFYARAKLSDDPEAKSVVDTMKQGVIMLGATPNTTIEEMFDELVQKVASMKKQTEAGG